jgi:hypothetical protein
VSRIDRRTSAFQDGAAGNPVGQVVDMDQNGSFRRRRCAGCIVPRPARQGAEPVFA